MEAKDHFYITKYINYEKGLKPRAISAKFWRKCLAFWPSFPMQMHTLVKMTLAFFAHFVQFYDAHILEPKMPYHLSRSLFSFCKDLPIKGWAYEGNSNHSK
jgi:hypothetical protein